MNAFLKVVYDQAKNYSTNHIMLTMGSDFQFTNAHQNFKNMDKLIEYVNERVCLYYHHRCHFVKKKLEIRLFPDLGLEILIE